MRSWRGVLAAAAVTMSAFIAAPAAQAPADGTARAPAAGRPPFEQWLAELSAEALARGFDADLVRRALAGVKPLPVVLDRDTKQVERTLSVERYLRRRLTPATIKTARSMAGLHAPLLREVQAAYGVSSRVLVSVWGLESTFGRFSGIRPTIPALATLAYDPRRGTYFRGQIFDALTILDRKHVELANLKGSWAGAMGQPQFMPSSYLAYAVDFDKDGRRDIWRSQADVFASIANYLVGHGWISATTWGREVRIPARARAPIAAAAPLRATGCEAVRQMSVPLPLEQWAHLGVTLPTGRPLPQAAITASLVPAGERSYLVYGNYEAILAYNCAHTYALSVALLADRI